MELLKEFKVPIMMNKKAICTINSWSNLHWATKSKLKNQYKEMLKSWFLDDEKLPKELHIETQPIYKDKRKRDAINCATSIKVIEDCLVEIGALEDDDMTSHCIKARMIDTALINHELVIKLYRR